MVNSSKYVKIYNSIIEKRKNFPPSGYFETHHILPKSLGGDDSKTNLVNLTAREHYLCHYLLTKIYENDFLKWSKMVRAFSMMLLETHKQSRYTSRLYEYNRKKFSIIRSAEQLGEGNTQYGTMLIHNKTLKKNKRIKKTDTIPKGWEKGAIYDFDSFEYKKTQLFNKKIKKEKELLLKKEAIVDLYNRFLKSEYSSVRQFVLNSSYPYSVVNLTRLWKKYVPEYNTISREAKSFKRCL
jgi:hypothetical protein